ncbi:fimbrial protein [Pectobacterium brasiliense]|uniref:Fimbrial protein n=1 Tax=Pectobacterium punjabense TaxID=2108399 RepID=A0ABX6KWR2_9GAMM|nr:MULTISPECIES: fimbrial protein [Pectobacterium]KHS89073.1 fimbrial protein [Pectobacterium brasiliense]MBS4429660.1 fimbrial protein [Pectobacterium punjabense]PTA65053.1 fimbrial protein [Pectobacterium punjabense]QJA18566.1 fimbrial protein [Pectobacterium punjabense]
MNMFCGRWALALLMSAACANATDLISPPVTEGGVMPEWQPNTRCTLSASNPVVDYGIMSRWQLQDVARGSVSPGTRSLMLNVACPHTRTMKLLIQGEGSEQGGLRYGGHGVTRLRLLDVQLDGKAVELRTLTSTGEWGDNGGQAMMLTPGQQLVPVVQGRLVEGKALTARLEVQPILAEQEAHVSSPQRSESVLTLTLAN